MGINVKHFHAVSRPCVCVSAVRERERMLEIERERVSSSRRAGRSVNYEISSQRVHATSHNGEGTVPWRMIERRVVQANVKSVTIEFSFGR